MNSIFRQKTNIAKALNVELRTIQKTFSQLERNASKGGSIVLEKILVYCAMNDISIDDLMAAYKKKQQKSGTEVRYVNFPIPEGLDERVIDVYHHADVYIHCVAYHLCSCCKKKC